MGDNSSETLRKLWCSGFHCMWNLTEYLKLKVLLLKNPQYEVVFLWHYIGYEFLGLDSNLTITK